MIDALIWLLQFIGYMFFMVVGLKMMDLAFQVISPWYRDYAIRRVLKKQRERIEKEKTSAETGT